MPRIIGNKVGVTISELEPWFKYDALIKSIKRAEGKSCGIKKLVEAAPGRCVLISFDTLPLHIQDALGDPRAVKHVLEQFYKEDSEALTFYSTYQFEDNSYLSIEHQERYIINASVLKAVLMLQTARKNERSTKGVSLTGINATLWEDATSFNTLLKTKYNISHTLPTGEKAFKQCLKAFETGIYQSLVSGKHKSQNASKVTDETLSLLESIFAKWHLKPSKREVCRNYNEFLAGRLDIINNNTGELYDPAQFKKLGDRTIVKCLSSWKSKMGAHAVRSGDRQKLMGQIKPYHTLKKPEFAGSIISIDDRQPPFKALNGKRVWFYNGIDLGSEAFTCWVYGPTKEGIILDFYRKLVRNYEEWGFNLPHELEAEMSLNSSFTDTFLREGAMFQEVRIEANNARGKRIERYFGNLRYGIEKKRDGWLARPSALSESNQAGPKDVTMLPYDTIIENALSDIEEWNNQPHSVHPHLSRWQYFQQKQHPNLKPTNYLAILPHMGYKTKTSCKVGIIHLDNGEYLLGDNGKVALGQKLINLMHRVEGERIEVCWLDDNEGKIFKALIFIGGQYICEAIAKPTYHRAKIEQTPACSEARAIMSAYVATIEGFGKKQRQSIDRITIVDNTPPKEKTFIMPGLKQRDYTWKEPKILEAIPDFDDSDERTEALSTLRRFSERY